MKVVINSCYGRFALSPAALKRYAELKGRECHFFEDINGTVPVDNPVNGDNLTAFDTADTGPARCPPKAVRELTEVFCNWWGQHYLTSSPDDRGDKDLVRVVEELGIEAASGERAKLKIVEIPDDIEWDIATQDGWEWIEEAHRNWV